MKVRLLKTIWMEPQPNPSKAIHDGRTLHNLPIGLPFWKQQPSAQGHGGPNDTPGSQGLARVREFWWKGPSRRGSAHVQRLGCRGAIESKPRRTNTSRRPQKRQKICTPSSHPTHAPSAAIMQLPMRKHSYCRIASSSPCTSNDTLPHFTTDRGHAP